jgi:hypothetical protein
MLLRRVRRREPFRLGRFVPPTCRGTAAGTATAQLPVGFGDHAGLLAGYVGPSRRRATAGSSSAGV